MTTNANIADNTYFIRVPKKVADITICGGLTLQIDDTMAFTRPTPEQIKNLKEMLCIDITL
jgi:hypothetical protein